MDGAEAVTVTVWTTGDDGVTVIVLMVVDEIAGRVMVTVGVVPGQGAQLASRATRPANRWAAWTGAARASRAGRRGLEGTVMRGKRCGSQKLRTGKLLR